MGVCVGGACISRNAERIMFDAAVCVYAGDITLVFIVLRFLSFFTFWTGPICVGYINNMSVWNGG